MHSAPCREVKACKCAGLDLSIEGVGKNACGNASFSLAKPHLGKKGLNGCAFAAISCQTPH
jgi:hypothetical protein